LQPMRSGTFQFGRFGAVAAIIVFSATAGACKSPGTARKQTFFADTSRRVFGWPNLYKRRIWLRMNPEPGNRAPTAVQGAIRVAWSPRRWIEYAASGGGTQDDYAFNRFAPLGPVHPYQHTTWTDGASASEAQRFWRVRPGLLRGGASADDLKIGPSHFRPL